MTRVERIEKSCNHCGSPIFIRPCEERIGYGKYCGRGCYFASRFGKPRELYGPNKTEELRQCLACGKDFTVGGVGNPKKTQTLCSDACQRAARYIMGSTAKAMSPTDAAWLAGFIDGEGCVMLNPRRSTFGLRLTASNTHRNTLDRIAAITGVGSVVWYNRNSTKNKDGGWWIANGHAAETVLRQTIPFMVTKEKQAQIGITFQSRLTLPHLKADRSWQRELHLKLKTLNRRGPPQITHDIVIF